MANGVANPPALYRGPNPQNQEKRVSGLKNPISHDPRKGRVESENPIFSVVFCGELGIF